TGYDFRHLFIGSEGTLGFITKATLNLTRAPAEPSVFVFGVPELDSVMKIYHAYKSQLPILAFEMFTDVALKYVKASTGLGTPFETKTPYYVLMEVENISEAVQEKAMEIFEQGLEQGWMVDGAISQSAQQAKDLWRL